MNNISHTHTNESIMQLLCTIPDPEVPAINIVELGVVRGVEIQNDTVQVTITPTYSGCPAMKAIEDEIVKTLLANNITQYKIKTVLLPPWTTDWLTDEAKQKLQDYGIAPPQQTTNQHLTAMLSGKKIAVTCPYCKSGDTKLSSAFGSTACKALHYCNACQQPFEEFKCH
ncbi:MAG TPA: phenylacetate-CoA oxygenase subunit PaaJ [Bacteroidia bacterium]|nr:phenylacetate-CoA oxygenase subunit PaaJ [Bacteroidia bacterium]